MMFVNDFSKLSQADCQILHPGTRQLFRYWETIRAERAAPKRDDLNLRQISRLLPNVVVLEAAAGGDGFRWRLAGSEVCHIMRRNLTGQEATAIGDQFERATIRKLYDSVVRSLQPCLIRYRLFTNSGTAIGVEQLGVPMLDRQQAKVQIFGSLFAFADPTKSSYESIVGLELASARTIWTEHLPGDKLVERLAHRPATASHLRLIEGGRGG